nr:4Fe-4S dicluster domain-containing protein [Clostridia bacterium]
AAKKAVEAGLPANRSNNILQSVFFALTKVIPLELAVADMKKNNYDSYFKKAGQAIVDKNNTAVDLGLTAAVRVEIPERWATAEDIPAPARKTTPFVRDIVIPMDRQEGDKLPVSVFQKYGVLDGTWENGTSAYSKRGTAVSVPSWDPQACIQCNRCSMCCPHAAIRPVLLTEEEKASVPAAFVTAPAKGLGAAAPAYHYRVQVSPYDCLGCGLCVTACPAKEKGALSMVPFQEMTSQQVLFDEVAMNEAYLKKDIISDKNVKSIQFAKPYFQFSAACAGCAETTYIKLLSQLFGDHMYVGNAAGCSSAISGGAPILPYCKDCNGRGPAWEHSLFEDNAEFAYGFFHAQEVIRKELMLRLESIKAAGIATEAVEAYENNWKDANLSRKVTDQLITCLEEARQTEDIQYVLENRDYLEKKSVWAVGGDGWAYDIGFGGIDHVLAQNRNVNLLVLDTEVYSNTGGQSSKATPISATAKFAAGGKRIAKKDLGGMLMQYGYVYVAQVAMGADQAQTLRALREAEAYDGPSIVICYCPCLEQHIKAGMGSTQEEMKKAVECGYWHLYRYDPRRADEGKNPFQLDSKEPDTGKILDFLMGEDRFASLKNNFPEKADELYAMEVADIKARYAKYRKLASD